MALNPLTLVPASEKAKDVATLNDLGTHVTSAVQVTPVSSTTDGLSGSPAGTPIKGSTYTYTGGTNNVMYTYTASGWEQAGNPDALTDANFNTNITTIDGGKITTGTIDAQYINTSGLIAENIQSTSRIIGNNIEGAHITGALIEASVIKTSYLDLDGELEVMTNYHITPAMYSANPSLYTDSIYISANDEYRIPSLSNITDGNTSASGRTASSASALYTYNTGNVGSNLKAVKLRPTIQVSMNTRIVTTGTINSFRATYTEIKINNILAMSLSVPEQHTSDRYYENANGYAGFSVDSSTFNRTGATFEGTLKTYYFPTRTVMGISLRAYADYIVEIDYEDNVSLSTRGATMGIEILAGSYPVTIDFDNAGPIYTTYANAEAAVFGASYGVATAKTSSNISINNLI